LGAQGAANAVRAPEIAETAAAEARKPTVAASSEALRSDDEKKQAPPSPRLVRPPGHASKRNAEEPESLSQPAAPAATSAAAASYEERKRQESEARKLRKAQDARQKRIDDLESRIAEREQAIRDIEATMAAPGFYDNHEDAKPIIDKHQALMWEVGDLMHQWEELQQTDL